MSNGRSHNNKVFPWFNKQLSKNDSEIYKSHAAKLRDWLRSELAYYHDALPKIAALLQTAQNTLKTATGWDKSKHGIFHVSQFPDHPMTTAYIDLIDAVQPHAKRFQQEPDLSSRVQTLIRSVRPLAIANSAIERPSESPVLPTQQTEAIFYHPSTSPEPPKLAVSVSPGSTMSPELSNTTPISIIASASSSNLPAQTKSGPPDPLLTTTATEGAPLNAPDPIPVTPGNAAALSATSMVNQASTSSIASAPPAKIPPAPSESAKAKRKKKNLKLVADLAEMDLEWYKNKGRAASSSSAPIPIQRASSSTLPGRPSLPDVTKVMSLQQTNISESSNLTREQSPAVVASLGEKISSPVVIKAEKKAACVVDEAPVRNSEESSQTPSAAVPIVVTSPLPNPEQEFELNLHSQGTPVLDSAPAVLQSTTMQTPVSTIFSTSFPTVAPVQPKPTILPQSTLFLPPINTESAAPLLSPAPASEPAMQTSVRTASSTSSPTVAAVQPKPTILPRTELFLPPISTESLEPRLSPAPASAAGEPTVQMPVSTASSISSSTVAPVQPKPTILPRSGLFLPPPSTESLTSLFSQAPASVAAGEPDVEPSSAQNDGVTEDVQMDDVVVAAQEPLPHTDVVMQSADLSEVLPNDSITQTASISSPPASSGKRTLDITTSDMEVDDDDIVPQKRPRLSSANESLVHDEEDPETVLATIGKEIQERMMAQSVEPAVAVLTNNEAPAKDSDMESVITGVKSTSTVLAGLCILAIHRGVPGFNAKMDFDFTLEGMQWAAISKWNSRLYARSESDVNPSLCVSLGCCLASDLDNKLSGPVENIIGLCQPTWPTKGELRLLLPDNAQQRGTISLSPPSHLNPHYMVDITYLLTEGRNKLRLTSSADMSNYVIFIVYHPPSGLQLKELNRGMLHIRDWRAWMEDMIRPFEFSLTALKAT